MTAAVPLDAVDLGIDLGTFDPATSISLTEACKTILHGRRGHLHAEAARRYAKYGCRPLGPGGLAIILPTIIWCGQRRTMPDWCRKFQTRCIEMAALRPPLPVDRLRTPAEVTREQARSKAEFEAELAACRCGGGRKAAPKG